MYFALDLCDCTEVCEAIVEYIGRSNSPHWMMLVDGAFDYGGRAPDWADGKCEYYSQHEELDALREVSPYLIPINRNSSPIHAFLAKAIRHCNGRPMLSFISSNCAAEEVARSWKKYLRVRDYEGQSFLLRFADTRVMPALPNILTSKSWKALTSLMQSWLYIDRRGNVQEMPMCEADELSDSDGLSIDRDGFLYMLQANMPDAIINHLSQQIPEMVPQRNRSSFYYEVERVCHFAFRFDIDVMSDIVALVVFNFAHKYGGTFDDRVVNLLERNEWRSGWLIEALESM